MNSLQEQLLDTLNKLNSPAPDTTPQPQQPMQSQGLTATQIAEVKADKLRSRRALANELREKINKEKEAELQELRDDIDELVELPVDNSDTLPTANTPSTPVTPSTLSTPSIPRMYCGVDFNRWEALAYDLALDAAPLEIIADAYNIDVDQLHALINNPNFSKILNAKKEEVANLGDDAAFTVKMRMITNKATPRLLHTLLDPETSAKEFQLLFKTAVELAKLTPVEKQSQQVAGTTVTLNIQGVPGLEHLVSPKIEDAVYEEVKEVKNVSEPVAELQEL